MNTEHLRIALDALDKTATACRDHAPPLPEGITDAEFVNRIYSAVDRPDVITARAALARDLGDANNQLAFFEELRDFLENRADVAANCPDGTTPNEEMKLLSALHKAFPTFNTGTLPPRLAKRAEAAHAKERRHAIAKELQVAPSLPWYVRRNNWYAQTSEGLYSVIYKNPHRWFLWLDDKPLCEAPDALTARRYGDKHHAGIWKP